jgi:hypothetical protein
VRRGWENVHVGRAGECRRGATGRCLACDGWADSYTRRGYAKSAKIGMPSGKAENSTFNSTSLPRRKYAGQAKVHAAVRMTMRRTYRQTSSWSFPYVCERSRGGNGHRRERSGRPSEEHAFG